MRTITAQVEITYDDTVFGCHDPVIELLGEPLQLVSPEVGDVVATCQITDSARLFG